MDGRFLFAAAIGILAALALQTLLTGAWVGLGAFRHGGAPKAARAIGMGLGLRALIGSGLPLCAAAWLAAWGSRPLTPADGAMLGFAIWAGFLAILAASDGASRASWLGSILRVFRRSLGRFATPPLPAPHAAEPLAPARLEAEVRDAFRARQGTETLRESLRAYLERLSARSPDRFEIDREANALFDDETVREAARRGDLLKVERNRFRELAASRGDTSTEEAAQWADALYARWSALREEGLGKEAAETAEMPAETVGESGSLGALRAKAAASEDAADAAAPGSTTAVAAGFKERLQAFKEFLRAADRSALNPDRLEQEVALLVIRNEGGQEKVDKEARGVRREDVAQVLRQRRDISSREADSIADLIDSARTRMLSRTEIREHRRQEATDQALANLQDRLYSLARPERDYGAFRRAIERLLEDRLAAPGAEAEIREWDRNSLQALFFSKQGISKADAEQMASVADAAFREAQESARRIQAEISRRRDEALMAAESGEASARSLAASSGRWLVLVSAAGAAASLFGGWLGARP